MANAKQQGVVKSTDRVARLIFTTLLQDFRQTYGKDFARGVKLPLKGQMVEFRDQVWKDYSGTSVPRFKAWYQLESMLKKYVFEDDKMTELERADAATEKYLDVQYRLANLGEPRFVTKLVLREARRIISNILGEYDEEEILGSSRFGRNSSIGCSLANSYLDIKTRECEAFTSSVQAYQPFVKYLNSDTLLRRCMKIPLAEGPKYVESLTLQSVPKTWKINRLITPLTLISQWLSTGLGVVIVDRLKEHGINLKRLQEKHRRRIRKYSLTMSHATVDLSSASDSISLMLLMWLFPRPWLKAIKATMHRRITLTYKGEAQDIPCQSLLPMGNGATFPLESLIFYALVRAIGNLLGANGNYSVYGDDIIVPKKVYPYLEAIFEDLGIKINPDKSFNTSNFRESCGADYYFGAEVRPFYVPNPEKYRAETSTKYIAWLHKAINSLLRRWDPTEIRLTLRMLLIELSSACGRVYLVPPSFPDTSGVKVADPEIALTNDPFPWGLPLRQFSDGTSFWTFEYLKTVAGRRQLHVLDAFYWDKLRSSSLSEPRFDPLEFKSQKQVKDVKLFPWERDDLHSFATHFTEEPPSAIIADFRKKSVKWRSKSGALHIKKVVVKRFYVSRKGVTFYAKALLRRNNGVSKRREDPLVTVWAEASEMK